MLRESYVSDPEQLNNKFVNINLSTLTNNFRDQNLNLTFRVNSVVESRARTILVKYTMLPSFLKRFVRRDKSKVGDSFIARDKNNKRIRIKPLIITHNLAAKSQQTQIRKLAKDFTKKYLQKTSFDIFVNELIKKIFQKKLRDVLKKVTPIKFAEIRNAYYEIEKFTKKETIVDDDEALEHAEEVIEEEKKEAKKEDKKEEKAEKDTKKDKEITKEKAEKKEDKEIKAKIEKKETKSDDKKEDKK